MDRMETVAQPIDYGLLSFPELLAVDTEKLSPQEYSDWLAAYSDTPVGFVEEVLELPLYDWQDDAIEPLDRLIGPDGKVHRVNIAVVAPNEAGKSERVVGGSVLYWLNMHPQGRAIVTSRDSKQIVNQVWPALKKHAHRFPGWDFLESPYPTIRTPTGGMALLFTTNDEGRAEGWHMDFNPLAGNFAGPLLMIIDEAKSVPEGIFEATDRCGYNVRMLISSPGRTEGTFYRAHHEDAGQYICVRAGLADCPHISQSKIEDLKKRYAHKKQYLNSVLYGQFMTAEEEQVFDVEGLEHLRTLTTQGFPRPQDARIDPIGAAGASVRSVQLVPCMPNDPSKWFRFWEPPISGCRYLIMCDSSKGRKEHQDNRVPDRQSVILCRDAYIDRFSVPHKPAVVARIIPPCTYRVEQIAPLVQYMSLFMQGCIVAVEENNTGLALIVLLKALGVPLYRRREGTPDHPKYEDGFYTHGWIRPAIIGEGVTAIYEQSWDIWCPHMVKEFETFVNKPQTGDGRAWREEAEGSQKDDDVMAWLIARRLLSSGTIYKGETLQRRQTPRLAGAAS